jgi:hypothetical protein
LSGAFLLKSVHPTDSIFVNHLGYEVLRIRIDDLLAKDQITLVLRQKSYLLSEVVVTPIDVHEMIRTAISKISDNYPKQYLVSRGTLRKQILKEEEYVFMGACTMDIAISSYDEIKKADKWGLLQRVSDMKVSEDKLLSDRGYLYFDLSQSIYLYPLWPPLIDNSVSTLYDWSIERVFEKSGDLIYKVNYSGKATPDNPLRQFFNGTVYISGEDMAIIAIRHTAKSEPTNKNAIFGQGHLATGEGDFTVSIYYTKMGGKWQLSYFRYDFSAMLSASKRNIFAINDSITMSIDYLVRDQLDIKDKKGFSKRVTDPFTYLKRYTKTDILEFSAMLPDYPISSSR